MIALSYGEVFILSIVVGALLFAAFKK